MIYNHSCIISLVFLSGPVVLASNKDTIYLDNRNPQGSTALVATKWTSGKCVSVRDISSSLKARVTVRANTAF